MKAYPFRDRFACRNWLPQELADRNKLSAREVSELGVELKKLESTLRLIENDSFHIIS